MLIRGSWGENITTAAIDLLGLPRGTLLQIGSRAVIEVTGLRNPRKQLDEFQDGLMDSVIERTDSGALIRKSGIMSIVIEGGVIQPGDAIVATLPEEPHEQLDRV